MVCSLAVGNYGNYGYIAWCSGLVMVYGMFLAVGNYGNYGNYGTSVVALYMCCVRYWDCDGAMSILSALLYMP